MGSGELHPMRLAGNVHAGGEILTPAQLVSRLAPFLQGKMSLLGRSVLRNVAGKRFFSAVTTSPKIAIAQNVLLLKEISNAADEAALAKIAASGLPAVNTANPPAELQDYTAYFSLSAMKSTDKFVRDPTAWQNMGTAAFVGTEFQRAETWPFFVGFV